MLYHPQIATIPSILAILETSKENLCALGIKPPDLVDVYNDYITRYAELTNIAASVSDMLLKATGVHAVRSRIKDPMHLLHKIIRKKKEYPDRITTSLNYLDVVNDLVGVRVLHLYKENWKSIAEYIQNVWDLKRSPYAYIHNNDTKQDINDFISNGYKVMPHQFGYRAVHFVIKTNPNKRQYFAEIQVRTLFEEAWSEIDHNIRYPDQEHYLLLDDLLQLLNKLTGYADDTASQILTLANIMSAPEKQYKTRKQEVAAQLEHHISGLPIKEDEKQQLYQRINQVLKH